MNKLEWYSEEVRNYYCEEINQTISQGRIYYLSLNNNKGYVIYNDWTSKKNLIIAFGIFEDTAITLRKEGSFFTTELNLYDIHTSKRIGSISNRILLNDLRFNTNANKRSIFNSEARHDMKFEIYEKYNDIILCVNVDKQKKKWYNNLCTTPVKGNIELPDTINWGLILCSFFSLHNYFLQRRQDD